MINILDIYNLGCKLVEDTRHKPKQYLGEVVIYDNKNCRWKIKLRSTGTRGRYLKLSSQNCKELRASADGYKSYLQMTSSEWEVLYRLAHGVEDVQGRAQQILNRLIGQD
ncbi:hypothetical protein F7734_04105 [Scytonema sp. UIC 10036]|uniref:hypothetical protein n=1 Tax=Scytonema sp. UIC 10036 TaxID=2304196 RepID=UPI0012DA2BC6|nr:hypothetical protein [Scytonema sp. UIC 10036]MUG91708.1 hypothetical protein [Scytonema sp. UIC 10036]